MHQPGQCGQVIHIKIIRLVQHQVAAHQAQHGCNLATTALAFSCRGQVVYGANQHGCGQQRFDSRVVRDALEQRVGLKVAVKQHMAVLVQ